MKSIALKNGRPSNDYGWSKEDLEWALEKHPESHPDKFELSAKNEQQRCRYIKALIEFLRAYPEENHGEFKVIYHQGLCRDVIETKWEGNTYEFYVAE